VTPARNVFGRLRAALSFELKKGAAAKLPRFGLLAVAIATVFSGMVEASAAEPRTSHALLAEIASTTVPLSAFFVLIMGCLAVNDEIGSRAMRAVLLRPVGRSEIMIAKIAVLLATAAALGAVAWIGPWAWVRAHGGFGAVAIAIEGFEPMEKFAAPTIASYARMLALATALPLLCTALFGLLVSLVVEAPGTAVAVGVFAFFALRTLGGTHEWAAEWLFPPHLDRPVEWLREVAAGIETNVKVIADLGPRSPQFTFPLVWAGTLGAASLAIFSRKEIRC
jgi:hypothetical protein